MNVYLDYSATTPQAKEVTKTVYDWSNKYFGNPSSPHRFGQQVKVQLEETRDILSAALGCSSGEIVFTSGGTESNNLALSGSALSLKRKGNHIIIASTEHPSVLETARFLSQNAFEINHVIPASDGSIGPEQIESLINENTILLSAMFVNNETGVINPVYEIGKLCRDRGIIYHCDAVQAFGKIEYTLADIPADLLSVSAHKIYGPKGSGALFIRKGTPIDALLKGGGQEANRRGGTENLPGIIGFGRAVQLIRIKEDNSKAMKIQYYFEHELESRFPFVQTVGKKAARSAFISNIIFEGVDNQSLLLNLDMAGIAASIGSACSSGSMKDSHVLKAMGIPANLVKSTIRFSYGRFTTKKEIDYTLEQLESILNRIRKS